MSGLKERLNRLKSTSPPVPSERYTEPDQAEDDWGQMNARIEPNTYGSFVLRERRYPFKYKHGAYEMGELVSEAKPLSAMSGSASAVDHKEMLFIDTETTGLGIGAGNVPFMIGFGYYTDDAFVVEQGFIRNPSEELSMLAYLQEKLQHYTHLVSYNGRTFDWPIVKNRYILNRLKLDDKQLLHLDLLYPSRALWRNTLPSCRLGTVEQEKLGLKRVGDIPGSMAPMMYFQYLASKNIDHIQGVFDHNEQDILTLAVLSIHFVNVLKGEISFDDLQSEELYRMGVWLDKMGEEILSEKAFEHLMNRSKPQDSACLLALAAIYKKRKNYTTAVQLWKRCIEDSRDQRICSVESFIELAKFYEHKQKDVQHALQYAEEAKQKAYARITLIRGDSKQRELFQQIEKRVKRLRGKQTAYLRSQ